MTDQEPNDAATAMVNDVVATNVDVGNPGQGTRSTFPQQIVRGGFTLLGKALQEQEVLDRVEDVVHMLEDAQTPLHNNIGTEGKELLKAYASGNAFGQTVQRRVQDELMAAAPDAAPGGNSVANRICAARSFLKCVNDAEQEVVDCLRSVQAWRDALDNATSNRTDAEKELLNAQSHLTECDTNLAKARAVADGARLNAETHANPDPEGETDAGVRTGRRLDKEVRDAERIVAEKQTAQEDAAELCARAQERLAAAQGAVNYTLLQMQGDEAQLAVLVQDRDGLRANYNKTATSIAGLIQKQSPTDALVSSITIDCMRLQQQRAAAEAADAEAGKQQATAEANRAREELQGAQRYAEAAHEQAQRLQTLVQESREETRLLRADANRDAVRKQVELDAMAARLQEAGKVRQQQEAFQQLRAGRAQNDWEAELARLRVENAALKKAAGGVVDPKSQPGAIFAQVAGEVLEDPACPHDLSEEEDGDLDSAPPNATTVPPSSGLPGTLKKAPRRSSVAWSEDTIEPPSSVLTTPRAPGSAGGAAAGAGGAGGVAMCMGSAGGAAAGAGGTGGGDIADTVIGRALLATNQAVAHLADTIRIDRAAEGKDNSMPKSLRPFARPGHVFGWASHEPARLQSANLAVGIGSTAQLDLCPGDKQGVEAALAGASDKNLLRPIVDIFKNIPSSDMVPYDFVDAYRGLVQRLVAAVGPMPQNAYASKQAAKLLRQSLEYWKEDRANVVVAEIFRRTLGRVPLSSGAVDVDPMLLLDGLVDECLPTKLLGEEDDVRTHLIRRYTLDGVKSTPSAVLGMARRVADSRHKGDVGKVEKEAKSLFAAWVRHWCRDDNFAKLLRPIKAKLDDASFAQSSFSAWETQLRHWEAQDGALAPLLKHLAPAVRPSTRRGPTVGAVDMDDEAEAAVVAGVNAVVPTPIVQQRVQPLLQTTQAPAVDPQAMMAQQMAPYVVAAMQQYMPAPVQVPAQLPIGGGTLRINAATAPFRLVFNATAFSVTASKMKGEWVDAFGVAGQTPPATPPSMRPWLKVTDVCSACDIPLPAGFVDRKHVAGDTCPFCMWLAAQLGLTMQWHLHPDDKARPPNAPAKPAGRQHMFMHQVFRCAYGLAIVHQLNRQARDQGHGDRFTTLFENRPFSGQQ
jgi:hypothetical protein